MTIAEPVPAQQSEVGQRTRTSDSAVDREWDDFLDITAGSHHAQSSRWGQLKATGAGGVKRVMVTRDGAVVGGAQMLLRRLPLVGLVGYIPQGPVIAESDAELTSTILDELRVLASQDGVRYLLVQPSENEEQIANQLQAHDFAPTPLTIQPTATVKIDLTIAEDQLFARMKKRTRREIRRGLAAGLAGREGTEEDLPRFHRLLSATAARQGFTPFSLSYFQKLWRLLAPYGWAKLFIVERGAEPVSAQIVVPFSDTVITKNIGWSGEHSHWGPNKILDWHTIQWAKQAGYHYYDLEGIDSTLARMTLDGVGVVTPEQHGRSYYKLNYGGDITLLSGAYDYLPNPILRRANQVLTRHFASVRVFDRIAGRLRNQ